MGSESNKQAQGTGEKLSELSALNWMQNVCELYERIDYLYRNGLDQGVPKEIARVIIPVGRYSRMRASANLRNWLQFLALRMAASAQWEIRQYANAVGETLSQIFPRTWELFAEEFSNANAK